MFPAHAGVILVFRFLIELIVDVPRACGGDPYPVINVDLNGIMFPAHAGVILAYTQSSAALDNVPRACGGDPSIAMVNIINPKCSPRMRG